MNNFPTPRMDAVIHLLGTNSLVADIGCDHGKLGAYLIKNRLADKVIMADISESSLDKARRLFDSERLFNAEFLVSDGFSGFSQLPDAAVIAGMGGKVINGILMRGSLPDTIVLQPMKDQELLYSTVHGLGYHIERIIIAREGRRFYEVMLVKKGAEENFSPFDKIVFDENARQYLLHKLAVLQKALNGAVASHSTRTLQRRVEIEKQIQLINEVMENAYGK